MARESFDLSLSHEWIGEFYFEEYDHRFFGKITYTPENGIILRYTIPSTTDDREKKRAGKVLHGVLDSGRLCTLFGDFGLAQSGFRACEIVSKNGLWPIKVMVIGKHLTDVDLFSDICFDFENTQEFFFPAGFVDYVHYRKGSLFKAPVPNGEISIENAASFKTLPSDLRSILFCDNDDVIEKLQAEWSRISDEHSGELLHFKNSLKFFFRLKSDTPSCPEEIIKRVFNLSNLMVLLLNSPVYPKEVDLLASGANSSQSYPVIVSIGLDSRTIKFASQKKHHLMLPLTIKNIDIEKAIKEWHDIADGYTSVVSSIQHETGYRTQHGIHSDLVLFSTQLEHINLMFKGKTVEKYTGPINKLGSPELIGLLCQKLGVTNNDYGKQLADLRNEIAHVGRPKKLLTKIGSHDQLVIAICLRLIIQSYLLHAIGVGKDSIFDYQKKNLPQ